MKKTILIACLTLFVCMLNTGSATAGQIPFIPESLKEIEASYAGKPFILVLWEINCPPCHDEMLLLGRIKNRNPDINLVMVGTDPPGLEPEVIALQKKYGLGDVESWSFADGNIERLRYVIDPEWFGELPRNYFYDETGDRVGFSGKLNERMVLEWLMLE